MWKYKNLQKQSLKIYKLQIIDNIYLQLVTGMVGGFLNPVGAQELHHQVGGRCQ